MGDKSPKSINKKAKQKQAKMEKVRKRKQQAASVGDTLAASKRN